MRTPADPALVLLDLDGTLVDVATGRNAGIAVWAVTCGYNMGHLIARAKPDRLLPDLRSLLGAMAQ